MKIHLLGSSGSGTSTIGKILAKKLNIHFFESDDFFGKKQISHSPLKNLLGKENCCLKI